MGFIRWAYATAAVALFFGASSPAWADSPLTSGTFHAAYEADPSTHQFVREAIRTVQTTRELTPEILRFIAHGDVPLGEKLAIIDALKRGAFTSGDMVPFHGTLLAYSRFLLAPDRDGGRETGTPGDEPNIVALSARRQPQSPSGSQPSQTALSALAADIRHNLVKLELMPMVAVEWETLPVDQLVSYAYLLALDTYLIDLGAARAMLRLASLRAPDSQAVHVILAAVDSMFVFETTGALAAGQQPVYLMPPHEELTSRGINLGLSEYRAREILLRERDHQLDAWFSFIYEAYLPFVATFKSLTANGVRSDFLPSAFDSIMTYIQLYEDPYLKTVAATAQLQARPGLESFACLVLFRDRLASVTPLPTSL